MTKPTLRAILATIAVLALAACASPAPTPIPQAAAPTAADAPTAAPTSTPQPAAGGDRLAIRKNLTLSQDSGGLAIELRRLVIADKAHMEQALGGSFADASLAPEAYEQADLVGEFILHLRNTSGKTLNVYPDQSTVLVRTSGGVRQIDLTWESSGVAGLDSVGGEIYADVVKVGGFWYPLTPGIDLADIQAVTLRFDGPSDDNLDRAGPDYVFDVDLSDHPDDEITDAVTAP